MTNKEIREKVTQDKPIKQDRFANGIRTLINESPLINAIQNATRADERERVISEIDLNQILIRLSKVKDCGTCVRCEEMLEYVIGKLNSIKP